MTHTYAILLISAVAYQEIRAKLVAVGYEGAFHEHEDGEVVDMSGVAVQVEKNLEGVPIPLGVLRWPSGPAGDAVRARLKPPSGELLSLDTGKCQRCGGEYVRRTPQQAEFPDKSCPCGEMAEA